MSDKRFLQKDSFTMFKKASNTNFSRENYHISSHKIKIKIKFYLQSRIHFYEKTKLKVLAKIKTNLESTTCPLLSPILH